ncbi:GMC oxidoreductase [Bradyrhizobium frederickii]|uniref:GMC oxidoreductase n=1 Tax=Bradyrhizobium frederickii TaxID=2560054 RepID=UPI0024BFBE78|nr:MULTISPECIES: GMC oxidoreductase [Bradyrhizobium]
MPPFGSHVLKFCEAPALGAGREADEAYIRKATVPFFHPVGTCRMGADDRAVLSPSLQVRGTENLWVADASIFPRHIAGNTNATSIMIGERAADLIHP